MTGLTCSRCDRILPLSAFPPLNQHPVKSFNRVRLSRCHDCKKQYNTAYGKTPQAREAKRNRHQLAKYGITREQREQMFFAQGGKCAVCRRLEPDTRGWVVDHNHKTSRVRGVLCGKCNTAIGLLDESTSTLLNCIDYLLKDMMFYAKPATVTYPPQRNSL